MTNWVAFALVVNAVLVVVLSLARATQEASTGGAAPPRDPPGPDTGERSSPSPGSQARRDAEAESASSPDSASPRQGAGTREASSEPSVATAPEDAAEQSSASPRSASSHEDAEPQGASSPAPTSSRQDAAEQSSATPGSQARRDAGEHSSSSDPSHARDPGDIRSFSTGMLLANVAVTHGTLGAILLVAAWASGIPARTLGIDAAANVGPLAVAVGVALGVALYAVNELLAANLDRVGVEYSERLRGALGPDTVAGWIVLLAVVLPIIAVFEELLFRAALIGAMSSGFGISPWILAVASSLAFGVGHGIQGATGMIVTGLLGFVLAAAFLLTGSLLTVVVAHYLINALEFVVHEWAGIDWAG